VTDVTAAGEDPADRVHLLRDLRAAGLYDENAPDAADCLKLLVHLAEGGVSIDEMIRAKQEGRLPLLLAERILFHLDAIASVDEVVAETGIALDALMRVRLASGFASDASLPIPRWAAEDVAGFELGAALFGPEPLIAFTRVVGAAAAKVAEAAVALFVTEVNPTLAAEHASALQTALANERAAALIDVVERLLGHLLREHLALAVRNQRVAGPEGSSTLTMSVGFVDLVGSTQWSARLTLAEGSRALARFESAAWDAAARFGGRVVKLIGDEAMVVAVDPDAVVRTLLAVVEACADDPVLPPARAAAGLGAVLFRDGDYFGPMVSVVARAMKIGDPGTVLATDDVRQQCERVGTGLRFVDSGAHHLRGVENPVQLFTVEAAP
jgi:adenylate cyclase